MKVTLRLRALHSASKDRQIPLTTLERTNSAVSTEPDTSPPHPSPDISGMPVVLDARVITEIGGGPETGREARRGVGLHRQILNGKCDNDVDES